MRIRRAVEKLFQVGTEMRATGCLWVEKRTKTSNQVGNALIGDKNRESRKTRGA